MTERRVDDSRLCALPGYHLRRAYAQVISLHRESWMQAFHIGIYDYAILILIDANPGIRAAQLSRTLGIAKPNMVAFIDRLQARGWIVRKRSSADARVQELRLSTDGAATARAIEKSAMRAERKYLDVRTEGDADKLVRLLTQLYAPSAVN